MRAALIVAIAAMAGTEAREDLEELILKEASMTEQEAEEICTLFNSVDLCLSLQTMFTRSDISPLDKSKVAGLIGICGCEGSTSAMVELLETMLSGEIGEDDRNAIKGIIQGIGMLGEDDGLDFLVQVLTDEYWSDRKVYLVDFKWDELQSQAYFQYKACAALGASAKEEGIERLQGLLEKEEFQRLQEHLSAAIMDCQQRISGEHLLLRDKYQP